KLLETTARGAAHARQVQVAQHDIKITIEIFNRAQIRLRQAQEEKSIVNQVFSLCAALLRQLQSPVEQPSVALSKKLLKSRRNGIRILHRASLDDPPKLVSYLVRRLRAANHAHQRILFAGENIALTMLIA